MDYDVIYSSRKTIGLTVRDARLLVRAPYGTSSARISAVVEKHRAWIESKVSLQLERQRRSVTLTEADVSAIKSSARQYFLHKTDEYSKIMGLKYSRITITSAQKRFGSCNSKGNICFSWRLMLYPEPAREYVIVHELAHLVHLNHSRDFYALVARYMPDYKERRKLLKT